jgi:hypothetical protein
MYKISLLLPDCTQVQKVNLTIVNAKVKCYNSTWQLLSNKTSAWEEKCLDQMKNWVMEGVVKREHRYHTQRIPWIIIREQLPIPMAFTQK